MKLENNLRRNELSHSGQAMVEFVILLTVIMILCSGMLYSSRLLSFDSWAQQEARYLAFEQTWASHWGSGGVGDALGEIGDSAALRRSDLVSSLTATKNVNDDGDVDDLLPLFARANTDRRIQEGGTEIFDSNTEAPVMLAKNQRSIWRGRTSEWFSGDAVSIVDTAFATQRSGGARAEFGGEWPDVKPEDLDFTIGEAYPEGSAEIALVKMLTEQAFGEDYCFAAKGALSRRGISFKDTPFGRDDCGAYFNREFGVHLGQNLNVPELFLDYQFQLDEGLSARDGFKVAFEKEIGNQFYSFFDDRVRDAFDDASPSIRDKALSAMSDSVEDVDSVNDFFLRYLGSDLAIGSMTAAMGVLTANLGVGGFLGMNRNWQTELDDENAWNDVLHADATDPFGVGPGWSALTNGYYLGVPYLPNPPTMVPLMGGLYDVLMHHVLDRESDRWDELVDESNKEAVVSYSDGNGVFPAARRRFRTGDKTLTARFYLVTQPWHITRRESPFGPFRQLGSEDDSRDEETEEAMLRRRTTGLYLIPSRLGDFVAEVADDFPALQTFADVLRGVDTVISEVKAFILGNPLLDFMYTLQELPGFNFVDFTPPRWPAVRPAAYPHTEEIVDDRMSGSPRTFADFVKEQRDNNPKADPEYHD